MIQHCLFPVAGFGTRFLPVTKTVPKELLPILDKPLIQYAIDEAYESGITEMVFVVNKYKSAIKEYFEPFPYLESLLNNNPKNKKLDCIKRIIGNCNLNFVNQTEMLGLGHAILQAKEHMGSSPFAVILPDDLCFEKKLSVINQMLKIHESYPDKCIVAIEEVENSEVNKYGIVNGEKISDSLYSVREMIEKPSPDKAPTNLAIIGRYILTPDIFSAIESTNKDPNGEIQVTDALRKLALDQKVIAYKFKGIRMDCGSVEGFLEANNYFANKY